MKKMCVSKMMMIQRTTFTRTFTEHISKLTINYAHLFTRGSLRFFSETTPLKSLAFIYSGLLIKVEGVECHNLSGSINRIEKVILKLS